ncbi:MAG TPA: phosphatidate cytidylyltransferase [Candidatus Binataceae bacterium]|nr:phosphatidate cytidylyltransferase [Candidatus Binataceae bacterium]
MLRTRLWTAIVVLPATIAIVLFASATFFTGFIAILTAWGLYEIVAMTKANASETVIVAIVGGVPAIMLLLNSHSAILALVVLVTILAMLLLVAYVARKGAEGVPHSQWFVTLGALWVGALFPYFALLRNSRGGIPIIILMLLLVVASDSGAYFVGRSLGRTKLLPRVSPNKTVEGGIGGLGACIIAAIILRPPLMPQWTIGAAVILATAVGLLAQLGDLAGSAYKRIAGVKDSGWLFPGHGGLLDRTCSLVFAATFTYYYLRH